MSDGCESCIIGNSSVPGSNDALGAFLGVVNGATGMQVSYTRNLYIYSNTAPALLNTGSMYSSYFTALPSIKADGYGAILKANGYNEIYGTHSSGALAIFVPQKQMSDGKGACTFLAGDLSIFKNSFSSQHNDVAKTLIKNMQPSSAACTRAPASLPPKVLFLSTEESPYPPYFIDNTYVAFEDAAKNAGGSIVDKRLALTSGSGVTFDKTDFDNVNVVVVATKQGVMDSALYATVETMMQTRPDLSFIIFTDTCNRASANCLSRGDATNAYQFEASLKEALSWDKLTLNHVSGSNYSAQPLNTASPWASAFKGTNPGSDVIRSHVYGVMECLPARNKLFNFQPDRCSPQNGNPSAAPGNNACFKDDGNGYFYGDSTQNQRWIDEVGGARHPDAAYTMLIPQWQSYKSKGSCIILRTTSTFLTTKTAALRPAGSTTSCSSP